MDMAAKTQKDSEERVAEEYLSSLSDLNCNSKPLINMLTMLAEENIEYAAVIVKVVEQHIAKVQPDIKLPILYLIDSIVKNVKNTYVQLFSQCIVNIFCGVFEKVNEKIRERMYALRQTWNEVFSAQKLYALDVKVKRMDTNWPITAKQPQPSIHVNPNFLKTVNAAQTIPSDMEEILHAKTRELLELRKRKLELELEATKKHLEEQEKQLSKAAESVIPPVEALVAANTLPAGLRAQAMVPGMIAPGGLMPAQHQIHPTAGMPPGMPHSNIRQGMYHHNFRMQRPHMMPPSNMMNHPGYAPPPPSMSNMGKPKVHPVNPSLLNTIRHRDPRLARQQQQQQQQQQQIPSGRMSGNSRNSTIDDLKDDEKSSSSSYRNSSSSKNNRRGGSSNSNSRARSGKSPTRRYSSSSPSKSTSGGRSSKHGSSTSSSRDKDKDKEHRKRSESKSSTTSSSSAGSVSIAGTAERRKNRSSSCDKQQQQQHHHSSNKYDKDAFEIAPLSTAFKRKSSSPPTTMTTTHNPSSSSTSNKIKDSRSSSKLRVYSRNSNNKNRSRSRSPAPSDSERYISKDVDLRRILPTAMGSTGNAEKRLKPNFSDTEEHEKDEHQLAIIATDTAAVAAATDSTVKSSVNAAKVVTTKDLDKNKKVTMLVEPPVLHSASSSLVKSSLMDVDLRRLPLATATVPINATTPTSILKQIFFDSDDKDNTNDRDDVNDDNSIIVMSSKPVAMHSINTITTTTPTSTTNITTTSSPKVSFKIQKLFNKLEKSTDNSSTASFTSTTTTTTTSNTTPTTTTTATTTTTTTAGTTDSSTTTTTIATTIGKHTKEGNIQMGSSSSVKDATPKSDNLSSDCEIVSSDGRRTEEMTMHNRRGNVANEDNNGMPNEVKKRSSNSAILQENEPLPKKSKSSKLDTLFGSEDVDLRTVMAPQILAAQNQTAALRTITPPPPPMISSQEEKTTPTQQQNIGNWDHLKSTISPELKISPKKSSSLEDVRAKLAKAAKYNKLEKSNKELSQRFKLYELNSNDDTQEANDEKIRTIIAQAQELLESNSINQEQYRNLVQTVMSINETNKLKEAKRRESLKAAAMAIAKQNKEEQQQHLDGDQNSIDAERNAAREAVLKKRIPKLPKSLMASKESNKIADTADDNNKSDGSPTYDDHNDDSNSAFKTKSSSGHTSRDRRNKPSKWGERIDGANSNNLAMSATATQQQQRNWMSGSANKQRGVFRNAITSVPHPPLPPMLNPTLHPPHMPLWQMGVNGPASAAPPPPQFLNQMPLIRANMSIGGQLQQQQSNVAMNVVPVPPPVIPKPCNSIDNPQADLVRTITIDGFSKEIRIYDQVAIVFMDLDQPREIGFQAGQRSIIIDNQDPITLQFNDDYKPIAIDNEPHRVRFGFPSRELYIDEHWYEIYFGGPPVSIPIKNKIHILKAEGPPPQVNIGPLRRDLVVGKINMIVDAQIVIPLFLDAKIQSFRLGENEHTIQFADNLLTVLLDGEPTSVEYGGLPKSLTLGGIKYFIRFSTLPNGVVAGKVQIKDMIYVNTEPQESKKTDVPAEADDSCIIITDVNSKSNDVVEVKSDIEAKGSNTASKPSNIPMLPAAALNNINIDELFQKLVSSGILANNNQAVGTPQLVNTNTSTTTSAAATAATAADVVEEPIKAVISPIDLSKPETIKKRQAAIIDTLFSGMQCSSCGVRFPPEQTIKYSQHLDWHFRQNRRERDSSRKVHSRKWYYDLSDWVQYEEIEDLEEREKNFFETQQNDLDANDEASNQRSPKSPITSCAAGSDDVDRNCDMCHEKFEHFYNEELEEWHLRSAIRVEDKIYHPLCFEDYKISLNPPKSPIESEKEKNKKNITEMPNADDDNAMDTIIKVEDDTKTEDEENNSAFIVDDDDDVIVLPNEEPSVTEIVDDDDDVADVEEEYIPTNVTRDEMKTNDDDEEMQSDVEIQEPHIPFTDLDTYVEKDLPAGDDASQMSFMNVKIKEEPKDGDEDDEDDDFEDVGTVVLPPEEISIQSSGDETQTQTITSSTSATSPQPAERHNSPTSLDAGESSDPVAPIDSNISMDGDLEQESDHNLSTAGPAPAVPLASLVNRIKINITKNIVSTSNSNNSNTTTLTSTTSNTNAGSSDSNTVLSTIPVLCGGGTMTTSNSNSMFFNSNSNNSMNDDDIPTVSNISVIGSYANTSSHYHHMAPQKSARYNVPSSTPAPASSQIARIVTPPPPVEDTIVYEVKPSLQKVTLKKMKKIESGIETSGLCSIM